MAEYAVVLQFYRYGLLEPMLKSLLCAFARGERMKCREAEEVPIEFDEVQQCWNIEVIYDGAPGWSMVVGNTAMQDAMAGYLMAHDQFLRGFDGPDAYIYALNVLYIAFFQDDDITDPSILCGAFQAFRKALIRQHDSDQPTMQNTEFQ